MQVPPFRPTLPGMGTSVLRDISAGKWPLDLRNAKSQPDALQRQGGFALLQTLDADPPGWWSADRHEQVNHFRDVVYVAIRAIMDAVSGATVQCVQRTGDRRQETGDRKGIFGKAMPTPGQQSQDSEYTPVEPDHPVAELLERPNKNWTLSDELAYLVLQNQLTGEAPVWLPPNEDGKPLKFFALPAATTHPIYAPGVNQQYPQGAWRVMPYANGGMMMPGLSMMTIIPGEEMARFRDPHPWNRFQGYSRLTGGAKLIDLLEMIDTSRWAAMDHGVQMDAALMVPGLTEDQTNSIQKKMTATHGGARNARKFAVLSYPGGSGEKPNLQTFSIAAREMDFTGSWDQCVGAVCAIFGTPKEVLNLATTTSYSALYAALRQFHTLNLKPYCRRLSEFLTKTIAWPWSERPGDLKIQVDLPTLDDPDLLEKQLALDVPNGIRTYNELRALRQLEPVGPEGDVPATIYLAVLQQKFAPQPQPGMEDDPNAEGDEQQQDDPLAALLGGGDTSGAGNTPTGGAVPGAKNAASEGTGLPRVGKAIPYDESKVKRNHGQFSSTQGAGAAPSQPVSGQQPAHSPESQKHRVAVAGIGAKMRDGQEVTPAEQEAIEEGLKHLTDSERAKFAEVTGGQSVTIAGHDQWRGKMPHPDTVTARPKTKKGRDEIGKAVSNAWTEARNAIAKKYGTREINDKMTPEEKEAESQIHSTIEPLASGNERDGPFDLGPISDQRYAGYYRAAVKAVDRLRSLASSVGKAMSSLTGSDGGFLVPETQVRVKRRKKRGRMRRTASRILKSLDSEVDS